jgi:hypothetical protein
MSTSTVNVAEVILDDLINAKYQEIYLIFAALFLMIISELDNIWKGIYWV